MTDDSIEAVWAEIPDVDCRGLCEAYCGPVDCSMVERRLLKEHGVRLKVLPVLTVGIGAAEPCIALEDGRCTVYDVRPTICRLWGAVDVDGMRCEHGCRPERYLTDVEARQLLLRARALR